MNYSQEFLNYIDKAVSPFHAVLELKEELLAAGYQELEEANKWEIHVGGKYFVTKNDTSVIAFQIPKDFKDLSMNIVASHTDSPTLKLKPNFETKVGGKLKGLNVEVYGGTIYSTWFDRPLGIAGRLVTLDEGQINTHFVDTRAICVIPNVAIHMNRTINDGHKYNLITDLRPIYADNLDEDGLMVHLMQGVNGELLGADLYLYNANRGQLIGKNNELIVAPQIDNLESAYLTLKGFLASENPKSMNIYAAFDNEEVGSGTAQGAYSSFLVDSISRVCDALSLSFEQRQMMIAKSFLVSCDNAHGVHPNSPQISDLDNAAYLNGGIVIKTNANQLYTTDAISMALFKTILKKAEVPFQVFANRSDIRGGSTLGHLAVQNLPISAVDIGLPQLAMHSAMETAGSKDCESLVKGILTFYNTHLTKVNGEFVLE